MNDFVVTIDNNKLSVELIRTDLIKLNGTEYNVNVSKLSEYTYQIQINNKVFHITANKLENNKFSFLIDGHYFESIVRTKLEEKASEILEESEKSKGDLIIASPMPGLILRLDKNLGDNVKKGDSLILLEAMKMENELRAPKDGVISEIFIEEGSSVEKNQKLIHLK